MNLVEIFLLLGGVLLGAGGMIIYYEHRYSKWVLTYKDHMFALHWAKLGSYAEAIEKLKRCRLSTTGVFSFKIWKAHCVEEGSVEDDG